MIPEAQKQQMAEAVAKIRETMAAAARAACRLQNPHGGRSAVQRRFTH